MLSVSLVPLLFDVCAQTELGNQFIKQSKVIDSMLGELELKRAPSQRACCYDLYVSRPAQDPSLLYIRPQQDRVLGRPWEVHARQGLKVGLYITTILGGNSYLSWFYDREAIKD